jgi:hypothetical protein
MAHDDLWLLRSFLIVTMMTFGQQFHFSKIKINPAMTKNPAETPA